MSTIANNNVQALQAQRHMAIAGNMQTRAMQRIGSGLRINSAADDASGLAISEKMRAQIRGLNQAQRNAQDGISLLQTAEGGLEEINNMLQRMRELITNAASDTNDLETSDRQSIQDEINQLIAEIDQTSSRTEFNRRPLLDGRFADDMGFQAMLQTREDRDSLAMSQTSARVNAFSEQLSNDRAALSIARENFNAAQATFSAQTQIFVSAENTYHRARETYAASVNHLRSALVESGLATLSGLTEAVVSGLNNPQRSDLRTALENYHAAAAAYGSDTMNLRGVNQVGSPFASALATLFGGSPPNLSITSDQAAGGPGTQIYSFAAAQRTFSGQQSEFDAVRRTMDRVQARVASSQTSLDTALQEFHAASVRSGATQSIIDRQNSPSSPAAPGSFPSFTMFPSVPMSSDGGLWFQTGANANQGMVAHIGAMDSQILGLRQGSDPRINMMHRSGDRISAQLGILDDAISYVSGERSRLGAYQNRLEHTMNSLAVAGENLTAAESRIRDADMSLEMRQLAKSNIIQQAAISMLTQANVGANRVLQLIGPQGG